MTCAILYRASITFYENQNADTLVSYIGLLSKELKFYGDCNSCSMLTGSEELLGTTCLRLTAAGGPFKSVRLPGWKDELKENFVQQV